MASALILILSSFLWILGFIFSLPCIPKVLVNSFFFIDYKMIELLPHLPSLTIFPRAFSKVSMMNCRLLFIYIYNWFISVLFLYMISTPLLNCSLIFTCSLMSLTFLCTLLTFHCVLCRFSYFALLLESSVWSLILPRIFGNLSPASQSFFFQLLWSCKLPKAL